MLPAVWSCSTKREATTQSRQSESYNINAQMQQQSQKSIALTEITDVWADSITVTLIADSIKTEAGNIIFHPTISMTAVKPTLSKSKAEQSQHNIEADATFSTDTSIESCADSSEKKQTTNTTAANIVLILGIITAAVLVAAYILK